MILALQIPLPACYLLDAFVLSIAPKKSQWEPGTMASFVSHSDPEGKTLLPSVNHHPFWLPGLCFLMGQHLGQSGV